MAKSPGHKTVHMTRKKKRIVLVILLFLLLTVAIFGSVVANDYYAWHKPDNEVVLKVEKGQSVRAVANRLKQAGIIKSTWLFLYATEQAGGASLIQQGTHSLNTNMSYHDLLYQLSHAPSPKGVMLTFPEGITLYKIAQKLENNGVCTAQDFIDAISTEDFGFTFVNNIPDDQKRFEKMEGYAFPETYHFDTNKGSKEGAKAAAKTFLSEFDKRCMPLLERDLQATSLTQDQLITLASIIQAEAGDIENMRKVASVFYNRLNSGSAYPRLESDPTKKYIRETIVPNASDNAIAAFTALYDTYQIAGLPPSAICNPGLDAIKAALNPADTNYYFFCSNLETREFFYATTFSQHQQNLKKAGLI